MRWVVCLGTILVGVWLNSILLIAMGILIFVILELSVRRQLATLMRGAHEVTVTMTDVEYRVAIEDRVTTRTWTAFSKVTARGEFWVLRISSQFALSLPKAALDESQTATFVAAMRAKGLLRK